MDKPARKADWAKIGAVAQIVGVFIAALIGSATLFFMWWLDKQAHAVLPVGDPPMPVASWMPLLIATSMIATAVLFIVGMRQGRAVSLNLGPVESRRLTPVEARVLEFLWIRWAALGDQYEGLDYDNRTNTKTRYPFNHSSWPNFGEPWEYVHGRLHSLHAIVDSYRTETYNVVCAFGWQDDLTVPSVDASVVMVDFIRAVREFQAGLEHKIKEIKQRKAWPPEG